MNTHTEAFMQAEAEVQADREEPLELTVEVGEVTGNITETELLGRYIDEKAAAVSKLIVKRPEDTENLNWTKRVLSELAHEVRIGMHLPSIHIKGKIMKYGDDRDTGVSHADALQIMFDDVHQRNVKAGWWHDLRTGEPLDRNVGELLCLVHSEISEAMEGHRKSKPGSCKMDDKLPNRPQFEVEIADALIRIFDMAGGLLRPDTCEPYDIAGALDEKLAYNAHRGDHKPENRIKDGGKEY